MNASEKLLGAAFRGKKDDLLNGKQTLKFLFENNSLIWLDKVIINIIIIIIIITVLFWLIAAEWNTV